MCAAHPCPTPAIRKKVDRAGTMWACTCGKVYVVRFWFNYAGEGYEWKLITLRAHHFLTAEVKS